MSIKFHWGTGIAVVYTLFAASMIFLVLQTTKHDVGLVKKEYYEDDINYQTQYNKINNATLLASKVTVKNEGQRIQIQFPLASPSLAGKILFFRPANGKMDFEIPISADAQGQMLIPSEKLAPGYWKVKVDWSESGTAYYAEEGIEIFP